MDSVVNSDSCVQNVCPYRFTVAPDNNNNDDDGVTNNQGDTLQFAYCGDRDMLDDDGEVHYDVSRVLIVLHGQSRDADVFYDAAVKTREMAIAAQNEKGGSNPMAWFHTQPTGCDSEGTIVLAPQFLTENDVIQHGLDDYHIFWRSIKWNQGRKSAVIGDCGRERPFRLSSFEIMDQMLLALDDTCRFPNLQEIVIYGHGAGSQYVQRYAAGNSVSDDICPSVSYVLANPGTQFYLSPKRAISGKLDQFAVPDSQSCPEYDEYKYGLQDMNSYMAKACEDTIRYNYVNRNINMMLGELDNNDWELDKTCAGMLQGRHRRERGVIFHNHLKDEFGKSAVAHHGFYFVAGSGHQSDHMMQSSCGLHLLYGVGTLERSCSATMSFGLERFVTCEGCMRNLGIGVATTCAVICLYYFVARLWTGQKKTPLLLEKAEGFDWVSAFGDMKLLLRRGFSWFLVKCRWALGACTGRTAVRAASRRTVGDNSRPKKRRRPSQSP